MRSKIFHDCIVHINFISIENDFFDSLDDNGNTDMAVDNWDIDQNFQPFDADVDIKPMKFETMESFLNIIVKVSNLI